MKDDTMKKPRLLFFGRGPSAKTLLASLNHVSRLSIDRRKQGVTRVRPLVAPLPKQAAERDRLEPLREVINDVGYAHHKIGSDITNEACLHALDEACQAYLKFRANSHA